MKLNFELTLDDLLQFNDYIQKTKGNKSRVYFIWGLLGIYLIYILYTEFQRGSFDWGTIVIIAFVSGLFYLFTRRSIYAGRFGTKRAVQQNPSLIGSRTVELFEDAVTYSTPNSNSTYKAEGFFGMEETKEYIYLFNGRTSAVIIPKRAFGSSMEIEELKTWVKNFTG